MADKKISLDDLIGEAGQAAELSNEALEQIVGGLIDPTAQSMILNAVVLFKKGGGTLSDLLKQLPEFYDKLATDPLYKRYAAQTNLEEVTAFVKASW